MKYLESILSNKTNFLFASNRLDFGPKIASIGEFPLFANAKSIGKNKKALCG